VPRKTSICCTGTRKPADVTIVLLVGNNNHNNRKREEEEEEEEENYKSVQERHIYFDRNIKRLGSSLWRAPIRTPYTTPIVRSHVFVVFTVLSQK
jgi:hypothetical protein